MYSLFFSHYLQANLEKYCREVRALTVYNESSLKCMIQSININMFTFVKTCSIMALQYSCKHKCGDVHV